MWRLRRQLQICGASYGGVAVLPRVKLFAWRACMEALPTKCGLHVRFPAIGEHCGVCGEAEKMAYMLYIVAAWREAFGT